MSKETLTAEELIIKYADDVLHDTIIIYKDDAITALEAYAQQFKDLLEEKDREIEELKKKLIDRIPDTHARLKLTTENQALKDQISDLKARLEGMDEALYKISINNNVDLTSKTIADAALSKS